MEGTGPRAGSLVMDVLRSERFTAHAGAGVRRAGSAEAWYRLSPGLSRYAFRQAKRIGEPR